jgi:hypothetical protein
MGSYSFQQAIFVQMFRRWSAARDTGVDCRLTMAEAYRGPGTAMMAAVAADSLIELVEAHLGRRLAGERCCSPTLAPDEAALLGLLHYAASADSVAATAAVPHGLSGAIRWAARAVRRELGFPRVSAVTGPDTGRPVHCPFYPSQNGSAARSGSTQARRASGLISVLSRQ